MQLAKVVGTVVSTHKEKQIEGIKLLLLEKIDASTMKGLGDFIVAMDAVGAGRDEIVFYVTGSSARMTEVTKGRPTDTSITAIVDSVELDGKIVFQKSGAA